MPRAEAKATPGIGKISLEVAASPEYCATKKEPLRVELSQMFGTLNKRACRVIS